MIRRGCDIEDWIIKKWGGRFHPDQAVDFQTDHALYEVKSCHMFIKCSGSQNKQLTHHFGRFKVLTGNHAKIKKLADKEGKEAKYIFVLIIGRHKVVKTVPWKKINPHINREANIYNLKLFPVFGEGYL